MTEKQVNIYVVISRLYFIFGLLMIPVGLVLLFTKQDLSFTIMWFVCAAAMMFHSFRRIWVYKKGGFLY